MFISKLTSSMEKAFPDSYPRQFPEYKSCKSLKNMTNSLQLIFLETDISLFPKYWAEIKLSGDLAPLATLREVKYIYSKMTVFPNDIDDQFLRTTPGLYPDLLEPLHHQDHLLVIPGQCSSLWIDIAVPKNYPAGDHELVIEVFNGENQLCRQTFSMTVINIILPKSEFPVTQWFHSDCIADYYNVPVFSEKHWKYIENFMKTAAKNGITAILTPVFTPPLDTYIGGERPTVQLVDVNEDEEGKNTFGYKRFDRWVKTAKKCGLVYYEISHLFTQWGAKHAPKIMVNKNGKPYKKFGWETDSAGPEYAEFLKSFLTSFITHLKELGIDRKCLFHISDEPPINDIDSYKKAKETVSEILKDYTVMDALSNYEFYRTGIVKTPIVATNHGIKDFLEHNVPDMWVYYCCGTGKGCSNRFFGMPGCRTRSIGYQMYANNAKGFLQWGYNFYFNQNSYDSVNPYQDSNGDMFFPSGDGYSVYPGKNGEALESMRIIQFREGLEDRLLLEMCEKKAGREAVLEILSQTVGETDFDKSARTAEPILELRKRLIDTLN